jgi:archaemetzincin
MAEAGGILVVTLGAVDRDVLEYVGESIEETFGLRVSYGEQMAVPDDSFSPKRNQYLSTAILRKLGAARPGRRGKVLGMTDVDLFVPELNFVFGEADMMGSVAVISLRRLREEFYGYQPSRELLEVRAAKEAVHELGHTFGMGHCPDPRCIMYFSNSLIDTERKGPGFCAVCRGELVELMK